MNSRPMAQNEGEAYFENMLAQIAEYAPEQIIAVARSGFSYAAWVSQTLNKPLGVYYPSNNFLYMPADAQRIVFVDDNTLKGRTYLQCKQYMSLAHPDIDYKWSVLFTDWNTPLAVRNEVIAGIRLHYFSSNGYYGRRFSDEHAATFGNYVTYRELNIDKV